MGIEDDVTQVYFKYIKDVCEYNFVNYKVLYKFIIIIRVY